MKIVFDLQKRAETLRQRGLDFLDAPNVFAGACFTFGDERFAYSEPRYITIGLLGGRMVVLVWTPDAEIDGEGCRRIIS
ncbi:MAG TPA: BrnT family toxin, partial [Stellaceae bacterium]|nr:BrnT family toxin [Stellaceae bacterium]